MDKREQGSGNIIQCEWRRQKHNYVAGCCDYRATYNKFMKWCPYCRKPIHVMNPDVRASFKEEGHDLTKKRKSRD